MKNQYHNNLINTRETPSLWIFKIILVSIFFLMYNAQGIEAKEVDTLLAKKVAKNIYWERVSPEKEIVYQQLTPVLAHTEKIHDTILYYVFNFSNNNGFVIVSADDQVIPVLGFSFEGKYVNRDKPPAFVDWMNTYAQQILYVKSNKIETKSNLIKSNWEQYLSYNPSPENTQGVDPLLTTIWGQGCYFNDSCPDEPVGNCNHVPVGCVATAMAQIMKYYNFPKKGVGSNSYYDSIYGNQYANFGNTNYDWTNMTDTVNSDNPAIAQLMYHCGVSVNMNYTPYYSSSGCTDERISLIDYFSYDSNSVSFEKDEYYYDFFKNMLINDLNNNNPVIYYGGAGLSHEFVCDGYQDSLYFHFNWGWSGNQNGYFMLDNLNPGMNLNKKQGAIFGIKPNYNTLHADFSDKHKITAINYPVNFQNTSTGQIVNCTWHFFGAIPEYSNELNPTNILYPNTGSFSVSVVVCDSVSCDTLQMDSCVTVIQHPGYDTIFVDVNGGGDVLRIQDAINISNDGSIILISPGTYYENVNLNGKNIILCSYYSLTNDTSFITNTIIDGSKKGEVIAAHDCENEASIIGLTIRNGRGAGISFINSSPSVQYCRIIENITFSSDGRYNGSAIYLYHSNSEITNSEISDNLNLSSIGGTIYIGPYSRATLTNCEISSNYAYRTSGIFFSFSVGSAYVVNCRFNNNYGRSLLDIETVYSHSYFVNCLIYDNSFNGRDACGHYKNGLINCTGRGDSSSQVSFINSTIVNNIKVSDSVADGTIFFCKGNGKVNIVNSILWNENLSEVCFDDWLSPTSNNNAASLHHCVIQGGLSNIAVNNSGTLDWLGGNDSVYPGFQDTSNCNFYLCDTSVCINSGNIDTSGLFLPISDLGNSIRIQDDTIDIGAYEFPNRFSDSICFVSDKTMGNCPLTVEFTDCTLGNPTSWWWNFGDGDTSILQNPIHEFNESGKYTITLQAQIGGVIYTTSKINYISCQPDMIFTKSEIGLSSISSYSQYVLPSFRYGTSEWLDYDNDMDVDLLVGEKSNNENFRDIYMLNNNIQGLFDSVDIGLGSKGYDKYTKSCDYDNDNDIDIYYSYLDWYTPPGSYSYCSYIYRNDGNDIFTQIVLDSIDPILASSADWGDYDHDGDYDLIISGRLKYTGSGVDYECRLYKNKGDDIFELVNTNFPDVFGTIKWCDFNNDGLVDVILSGKNEYWSNNSVETQIYRNDGNDIFTLISSVVNYKNAKFDIGDIDNDGDYDVFICGEDPATGDITTSLFLNDGQFVFSNSGVNFSNGFNNTKFIDYNNDGLQDLICTDPGIIYKNNGNLHFQNIYPAFDENNGLISIGDYDNDNDLDLFITGNNYGAFRNNTLNKNTLPNMPGNLNVQFLTADTIMFSWNKSFDSETPQQSLTYNFCIGTHPDSMNIIAPMSDLESGYRQIIRHGNTVFDTCYYLTNIDDGTYYWTVQTVDGGYAGSPFASVDSFSIIQIEQEIPLFEGWNIASFNAIPDYTIMDSVLQTLIYSNSLVKVINESGGFMQYIPDFGWMNTIGNMENTEGYYIKVSSNDTLFITGAKVPLPISIPLQTGWNIMGYPLQNSQNSTTALQQLIDSSHLVKVIDEAGGFIQYIPGFGWMNTIGNFEPGKGYYIKLNTNDTLVLNEPSSKASLNHNFMKEGQYYNRVTRGNPYMPMHIVADFEDHVVLAVGDELGVFVNDICIGSAYITDPSSPVLTFLTSDDPTTETIDGGQQGDILTFKLLHHGMEYQLQCNNYNPEDLLYTPLETKFITFSSNGLGTPDNEMNGFYVSEVIPNPMSKEAKMQLHIPETGSLNIDILNLQGVVVKQLFEGEVDARNMEIQIDGNNLNFGMYFILVQYSSTRDVVRVLRRIVVNAN